MTTKRTIAWAALLALLAVLIGLAIWFPTISVLQYFSDQEPQYLRGASFLNSVADKLGRTSQNQISDRHLESFPGALYPYDYIEMVFSTDKTDTQLADELENLESLLNQQGISLQSHTARDRDSHRIVLLQNSGLPLTLDSLSFTPGATLYREDWPFITTWIYRNSKSLAVMEIDLMEPNSKGDKWKYRNKVINENILILTLYLDHF